MTVPVSPYFIDVLPGVIAAAGGGAVLTNLTLTQSTRVPIGTIGTFSSAAEVGTFFGTGSKQFADAEVYFGGYNNATATPGELLYSQYNTQSVAAFLQGGNISSLTVAQIVALTGNSLTVVIDGYTWTNADIDLTGVTSLTSLASTLQTALRASPPAPATFTGSMAEATNAFTAGIAGNYMYVTAVGSGAIYPGTLVAGTGVTGSTFVDAQLLPLQAGEAAGGVGRYTVTKSQEVAAGTSMTGEYGNLDVISGLTGVVAVGQEVSGGSISANITAFISGTPGGVGHYATNQYANQTSTSVTANGANPTVTYDSVSGSLFVTSGITGAPSTIAFATTGTLATALDLTAATGAVLSQGATPQQPTPYMAALINQTQNFGTFRTDFDPDGGGSGNTTQKLLFAAWNSLQNNRFAYIEWDTDPAPAASFPAASSFGYLLAQSGYSGTIPNWESGETYLSAFVAGMIAAINFNTPGGRITLAYKYLSGLIASVVTATQATNLFGNPQTPGSTGNGYNALVAAATATEEFLWYQRGTISGPFQWADTYVNQIWLNQSFIGDIAALLTAVGSIPYVAKGYATITQALQDTINTALSSGVIVAGGTLSATEIAEVNAAAGGKNIAAVIQQQGWYLLATPATPTQRQSRTSPPFTFYYFDGGSIQAITMGSIVLQ